MFIICTLKTLLTFPVNYKEISQSSFLQYSEAFQSIPTDFSEKHSYLLQLTLHHLLLLFGKRDLFLLASAIHPQTQTLNFLHSTQPHLYLPSPLSLPNRNAFLPRSFESFSTSKPLLSVFSLFPSYCIEIPI